MMAAEQQAGRSDSPSASLKAQREEETAEAQEHEKRLSGGTRQDSPDSQPTNSDSHYIPSSQNSTDCHDEDDEQAREQRLARDDRAHDDLRQLDGHESWREVYHLLGTDGVGHE